MRGKFQRFKNSVQSKYEDVENKVYEVLNTIECLHQMRIVQKIVRPIDFQEKMRYYHIFKPKFVHLHQLLENMRIEMTKKGEKRHEKHTDNFSTEGIRQKIKRDEIRKIQSTYREMIIEGSFKYYYMIAKLKGLPLDLQAISIEQWTADCLQQEQGKACC